MVQTLYVCACFDHVGHCLFWAKMANFANLYMGVSGNWERGWKGRLTNAGTDGDQNNHIQAAC